MQLAQNLLRLGLLLFVPAVIGLVYWLYNQNEVGGFIGAVFLGLGLWNRYWGYLTKLSKDDMKDLFGYIEPFDKIQFTRRYVWRAMRHWRTLVYPAATLGAFVLAVGIVIQGIPPINVAVIGSGLIIVLNWPLNRMFDFHFHLSIMDAEARQKAIIASIDLMVDENGQPVKEFNIHRDKIRRDALRTMAELEWRKQTFTSNELVIEVLRFLIPLLANAIWLWIYL